MKLFRNHLLFFVVIILFSLFACQKLFVNKFYTSHDGEGHVIRMIEFDQAIKDGQFPVRIAKRINYGLGYPFFNFNYPFIYYLAEGFHVIGFSFVDSFKALMILSVSIGGLSMYFFTISFYGKIGALASSLFYIIAPYRFLNMYVRGDVAESFGLSLVPLLLFSIDHFIRYGKYRYLLLVTATSMLILSHNVTAMIGILLGISYFMFKIKTNRKRADLARGFVISIAVSVLLTAFFWAPVLIEAKLTKLIELTEDYKNFFPTFSEILYFPWGFGAYKQGNFPGKMSPQIGLIHELMFALVLIFFAVKFIKHKKMKAQDMFVLFFIAGAFISIFLSLPYSKLLWDRIYFLQIVQLPWRLIGYAVMSISIVAGFLISEIRSQTAKIVVVFMLIILLGYANRNHIRVNQYTELVNPFLRSDVYGPSTTSRDEHMPLPAPRAYTSPNQNGDIIAPGFGTSRRVVWKSNYHKFAVNVNNSSDFRDNTSYFPGWEAQIDGRAIQINFREDEFYRLRVRVPEGEHKVEFFFRETWYRVVADLISVCTFIFALLWMARKFLRGILLEHQIRHQ